LEQRFSNAKVSFYGFTGRVMDRDDTFLGAFAEHPHESTRQIKCLEIESAEFSDAKSCAIEQFSDGDIS
jgi:hypothetical protein